MNYCDFIHNINSGIIKKVKFCISDYPHYRNCVIELKATNPSNINSGRIIWFYLTPDGYEKRGFLNKIREDTKLFYIKGKGSYTLKQIWHKVNILSVEYMSDATFS